ncbi:hypothetical protein EAE96_011227 [Botrytis aclada]|nr:hypothetical protein EAE96_011227 [Botrytis aclada]
MQATVTSMLLAISYDDPWAIFDILDHPTSTYSKERKVVIGDATHATSSSPWLRCSFAIEDPAVVAEMLATPRVTIHERLRAVFQAFDLCRSPGTQWLVASS